MGAASARFKWPTRGIGYADAVLLLPPKPIIARMSAAPDHAVILFAHGARDPRWARALEALAAAVRARLPQAHVELAFLELQPPTLDAALATAAQAGATTIDVMPVFWASGGHVTHDVPPLLDAFRTAHPHVQLTLRPVLSELPGMTEFIAAAVAGFAKPK
ncbi:MAG TPA: CbiX/SirB N-terminal domain-containing protein [Burkholderiaceae bacterium]|nr:CbiX/SirB N-terminal domain-containing protein [Burkholderiaceae bacterium]